MFHRDTAFALAASGETRRQSSQGGLDEARPGVQLNQPATHEPV